jgi:DNA-binding FadR family transcriptional regulator
VEANLTTLPARGQVLRDALQEYVKSYILTNNLKPGDSLPSEGQLARDLQVSRGSVREAIKALEALGVIEVRHGDGIFVRPMNFDAILKVLSYNNRVDAGTILDLLQVRKWLEVAIMEDIIAGMDDGSLRELEQIFHDWQANLYDDDSGRYDRAFHRALNNVVGNPTLTLFLDIFWVAFHNAVDPSIKAIPDAQLTLDEHRRIVEAIKANDVAAARQALLDSYMNIDTRLEQAPYESVAP